MKCSITFLTLLSLVTLSFADDNSIDSSNKSIESSQLSQPQLTTSDQPASSSTTTITTNTVVQTSTTMTTDTVAQTTTQTPTQTLSETTTYRLGGIAMPSQTATLNCNSTFTLYTDVNNTSSCIACSRGTDSCSIIPDRAPLTKSLTCSTGFYLDDTSTCMPVSNICPPGSTFDLTNAENCLPCFGTTYSTGNNMPCTNCSGINLGVATCSHSTGNATSCSDGYRFNTTTISCVPQGFIDRPIGRTIPNVLGCKPGYYQLTVAGKSKCAVCPLGDFTCYSATRLAKNVVATSCQAAYSFTNKKTCQPCPAGQGSIRGNTSPKCTKCLDTKSTVSCSTDPPAAFTCHSDYFLYKGKCLICPVGRSNHYGNSALTCQSCPGRVSGGTKNCNLNVSPTNITSCITPFWRFSLSRDGKRKGVCSKIVVMPLMN